MSRVSLPPRLLQGALRRPTAQHLSCCAPAAALAPTANPVTARSFSHLPTLRPSLTTPRPVFRSPSQTLQTPALQSLVAAPQGPQQQHSVLDLLAKSAITSHPALAQIRCGPRPTMANATRLIQKRRHGFLSRIRTPNGRKTLARRRAKGRKRLSA